MDLLERFPRAWCDTCQKVQAARGAAAALAGAFYHSVLLLLPHAVGLARLRAGRMVPDKPDIG
jgi:hypothetical protein